MVRQSKMFPTQNCQLPRDNYSPYLSSFSTRDRFEELLTLYRNLNFNYLNLIEENRVLLHQVLDLQRQLESSQAAYQALLSEFNHESKTSQSYESRRLSLHQIDYDYGQVCTYQPVLTHLDCFQAPIFSLQPVCQFLPIIRREQIMTVESIVTTNQSLVTRQQLPFHHRNNVQEKRKLGSELRLKAIIGKQEEKISSLTKQLAELKIKDQTIEARSGDVEEPPRINDSIVVEDN